jgi:hypothetical protein
MAIPGPKSDTDPAGSSEPPRRRAWRPLVRSLHRDMGYLAVGLTLVYALSGLAVNHIADWDPSFQSFKRVHQLGPLTGGDDAVAATVLERLKVPGPPSEVYRAAPTQLEVRAAGRSIHVDPTTGRVVEEGQQPRFLLRLANWLHLNRGKRSWTVIADLYAAGLLFLALSGLFMLPGKNGMRGRGGVLVALGVAIPVLYVALSGGPERHSGAVPPAPPAQEKAVR